MNPAKKSARIGQSFSSSWTFTGLAVKNEKKEKDILTPKEGFNFTDGIGKISKNLIDKIALELGIKNLSVIQMRYKGAKGVLSLHTDLAPSPIVLRDSRSKYGSRRADYHT